MVAKRMWVQKFAPGARIIQQGDAGDCFYVIENGVVSISRHDE